jgi:hypothetical protein
MKTKTNIIYPALALSAFACLALIQSALAVSPPPDGGYPGGNTAEGVSSLFSLTTGGYNTGVGFFSLRSDTTGSLNTAIGAGTLFVNTADENTATGAGALLSNAAGGLNTANGAFALFSNTNGFENTATGEGALFSNTTGVENTANGSGALYSNTTGIQNTAIGGHALANNVIGGHNTANGFAALTLDTSGNNNTGIGATALNSNTTGSNNTALGGAAGHNLTTGDYNIDIGNTGVAGEGHTIRIGDDNQGATYIAGIYGIAVSGLTVVMDSSDHLGTLGSSRRFKKEIKPMEQASEAIFALEPVTFHYKKEIDPAGTPQFGLVAEDVEKVNPDLVVRDKEGKPYSVRYDQVNAMLLNEFLKEHQKVQELEKQVEKLTTGLQKVSAQVEASKPAPQVVNNP